MELYREHKKRIRHMYTWMFRRYRTNTLADGGSISDKPVLGPELIPDASRWFDSASGWSTPAGWSIGSGVATSNGLSEGRYLSSTITISNQVGKTYEVAFDVISETVVGYGISIGLGGAVSTTFNSIGRKYARITAKNSNPLFITCRGIGNWAGTIDNISVREVLINSVTTDYLKMAQNNRMDKSIRFGWLGEAGSKITSGRVEKLYSFDFNNYQNNATQTTPTSRPFITGNIAPNEKLGLKNPNGGSNFMTHPTISFAANESWSVTTVFNFNGSTPFCSPFGSLNSALFLRFGSNFNLRFISENSDSIPFNSVINSTSFIGKNVSITLVANGNNTLLLYVNGIYTSIANTPTMLLINNIMQGRNTKIDGVIYAHIIRSQALTQAQVTAEYNYLRSVYPEIESVDIGTQTWATSNCEMATTPQGNVIQEMQAAGNVEKITNVADREFTSDTGFWIKQPGTTISGGTANIGEVVAYVHGIQRVDILTQGKWYKITVSIVNYISGSPFINDTGGAGFALPKANGTYTVYFKPIYYPNIRLTSGTNSNSFSYDNVSIQEVGWADSQNLYDYIYANTTGTVEQKTYAAVKEAGFWCHYNNDVNLGATYGKLYNWFAVKLLQMDIDYYNAANPTTPFGWRVPTQADFNTLATTLGGASVAGGKMKMQGTTYWNSPNTGADNSSGFSGVGGGFRQNNGGFLGLLYNDVYWQVDNYRAYNSYDNTIIANGTESPPFGFSLRLIKT